LIGGFNLFTFNVITDRFISAMMYLFFLFEREREREGAHMREGQRERERQTPS